MQLPKLPVLYALHVSMQAHVQQLGLRLPHVIVAAKCIAIGITLNEAALPGGRAEDLQADVCTLQYFPLHDCTGVAVLRMTDGICAAQCRMYRLHGMGAAYQV